LGGVLHRHGRREGVGDSGVRGRHSPRYRDSLTMFGRMGARGGFSGMGAGGDGLVWVHPGAFLDVDFARGRGWQSGVGGKGAASFLTTTGGPGYERNSQGVYTSFASNVPRITDLGLWIRPGRSNLFVNPG